MRRLARVMRNRFNMLCYALSKGFNITDFSGLNGKRHYHQFDFVAWFNTINATTT